MSDNDNSATRQLATLFGRSWRWARGCISALVSDLAARQAPGAGWRAMLLLGADGARLLARRKTGMVELGSAGQSVEQAAALAKSQLSRSEQQALALRFDEDRAIVQDMTLPEGARPLLGAILRNKIESLAPWPIEDTAWGYRAGDVSRGGTVPVTVGIVGRKALSAPLQALAAQGIKPVSVEIASAGDAPPVLIDHSSDSRRNTVSLVMRTALGAIAVVMAVGGAYGGFLAYRDASELTAITERTEQLRRELSGRASDAGSTGQVAEANKLVEAKKTVRPTVVMINELTKNIPDGSWLTAVDVVESQLTVQGRGGPATELITSLEQSEAFSNVNFAAATQRDEEANTDVYSISAAIEPMAVPK